VVLTSCRALSLLNQSQILLPVSLECSGNNEMNRIHEIKLRLCCVSVVCESIGMQ